MASLPLLIYTELTNPQQAGVLRVWGAALTLILMVAAINLFAAGLRSGAGRQVLRWGREGTRFLTNLRR
jgi:phosphate transport system permease protein